MAQSPRAKRPRSNDNLNGYPSPPWPNGMQRPGRVPMTAAGYDPARAINQRGASYQPHSNPGMMETPRSTPTTAQFPQHTPGGRTRPQNMDDLRLPPLHNENTRPGSIPLQQQQFQPPSQLQRNTSPSHSQTIEAMVMTIPFLNKIRVLAKIAPPLPLPGPTNLSQEVRGLVIAVEGADPKLVSEVGRYIEDYLSQKAEYSVQTWTSGNAPIDMSSELVTCEDVPMTGGVENSDPVPALINFTIGSQNKDPIIDYLEQIRAWHSKSFEIRKFITALTAPTAPASKSPEAPSNSPLVAAAPASNTRVPVALLPAGFSLSLSDRAAINIPVNDSYAPVDHWQWMATLWRGIIGADLTVYVCHGGPGEDGCARGASGGVEVRNDARVIVVHVVGGKVEDKWLRRVGFEVGEFVIGGELKG